MLDAFHSRMYGRGQQSHCTVDSALLTSVNTQNRPYMIT